MVTVAFSLDLVHKLNLINTNPSQNTRLRLQTLSGSLCNQCGRLALDVRLPIVQLLVVIGLQVLLLRRGAAVMSASLPEEKQLTNEVADNQYCSADVPVPHRILPNRQHPNSRPPLCHFLTGLDWTQYSPRLVQKGFGLQLALRNSAQMRLNAKERSVDKTAMTNPNFAWRPHTERSSAKRPIGRSVPVRVPVGICQTGLIDGKTCRNRWIRLELTYLDHLPTSPTSQKRLIGG